jgi:hypothetical protein
LSTRGISRIGSNLFLSRRSGVKQGQLPTSRPISHGMASTSIACLANRGRAACSATSTVIHVLRLVQQGYVSGSGPLEARRSYSTGQVRASSVSRKQQRAEIQADPVNGPNSHSRSLPMYLRSDRYPRRPGDRDQRRRGGVMAQLRRGALWQVDRMRIGVFSANPVGS